MTTFLIVASIMFLFLGVIWKKDDIANVVFKVAFLSMCVWGGVLTLEALGFIIKV